MNKKRPVNLNLFAFHFPLPAITSILHRISGIMLFVFIPGLLWVLDQSLQSEQGFQKIAVIFSHPVTKVFLWMFLSMLAYHLVAGIKHLLMDLGLGETLQGARIGAWLTLVISLSLVVLLGVWIWLPM